MAFGDEILRALWLFLPAYVANMSPVFSAKVLPRWSTPIDFGSNHADGRRMLGNGKTWRGLIIGGIIAGITALLMAKWPLWLFSGANFGIGQGSSGWGVFLFGFMMGFMALVGDAVESFFKRRRNLERGAPWIPFDQLDFVVFGLASAFIWSPLLAPGWAVDAYFDPWVLGTLIIGTPVLHLLVNRVGYWLRLKDVPW